MLKYQHLLLIKFGIINIFNFFIIIIIIMKKRFPKTIPQIPYKKSVKPPPPTYRKSGISPPTSKISTSRINETPQIPTSRNSVISSHKSKISKISKISTSSKSVRPSDELKDKIKKVMQSTKLKDSKLKKENINLKIIENTVGGTETQEIQINFDLAKNINKNANKIVNEEFMKNIKTIINKFKKYKDKLKTNINKLKTKIDKFNITDNFYLKFFGGTASAILLIIFYEMGYEIEKSIRYGRYPCTKDDDCLTAQKEEINEWNVGTEITNLNKYTKYKCLKDEKQDRSYCTKTDCDKDEECNDENLICNNHECQYKCYSNNDCDDNETCDNNICKVKCDKSSECYQDNNLKYRYFQKCLKNEQDLGKAGNVHKCKLLCIKNKCEKKCIDSEDCNYGYKCIRESKDSTDKYCKKITCESNNDCYEDEVCHNYICKENCNSNKDCKNSYIKDYSCNNDCNVLCNQNKCEKECESETNCDEDFFTCFHKYYDDDYGICKSKHKENFSQNLSKNYTINEILIEFNKLMIDLKKKFKIIDKKNLKLINNQINNKLIYLSENSEYSINDIKDFLKIPKHIFEASIEEIVIVNNLQSSESEKKENLNYIILAKNMYDRLTPEEQEIFLKLDTKLKNDLITMFINEIEQNNQNKLNNNIINNINNKLTNYSKISNIYYFIIVLIILILLKIYLF